MPQILLANAQPRVGTAPLPTSDIKFGSHLENVLTPFVNFEGMRPVALIKDESYNHRSSRPSAKTQVNIYSNMPAGQLHATDYIRQMRGGSQSKLLLAADETLWVVKFYNNPQHDRLAANCWIGTHIARAIGLSVPRQVAIMVSKLLIRSNAELVMHGPKGLQTKCQSGLQFGSQYAGGLMPGLVTDELSDGQLRRVANLREFAGILALDKWLGNTDRRQAVFSRSYQRSKYHASFIDQGNCFGAGKWAFYDNPILGLYPSDIVYGAVRNWESFEPWLSRIEHFSDEDLWSIAQSTPPEWCGSGLPYLDALISNLIRRKSAVRGLIDQCRRSSRDPFPKWKASCEGPRCQPLPFSSREQLVFIQ